MESILIFGDSNTWGLVPGSYKEANPDARDEEHLNEEGHKNLARIVYQKFLEINFII